MCILAHIIACHINQMQINLSFTDLILSQCLLLNIYKSSFNTVTLNLIYDAFLKHSHWSYSHNSFMGGVFKTLPIPSQKELDCMKFILSGLRFSQFNWAHQGSCWLQTNSYFSQYKYEAIKRPCETVPCSSSLRLFQEVEFDQECYINALQ